MLKFLNNGKSAVLFPLIFLSACVSTTDLSSEQINKQQAAKARIDLALGYLAQHNMPQAKINLDKAFSHAPDYYLVHSALAYFYQKQGNIEQAQQAYLRAIALDDKQGDSYNNYGTFLCTQGLFEQAYHQFQTALNMPHYYHQADTYENMVLCNLMAKDNSNLWHNLEQLKRLDPIKAEALSQQIKINYQELLY